MRLVRVLGKCRMLLHLDLKSTVIGLLVIHRGSRVEMEAVLEEADRCSG